MKKSILLSTAFLITIAAYAITPKSVLELPEHNDKTSSSQPSDTTKSNSPYKPGKLYYLHSDNELNKAISAGYVVVDIYTDRCPPCRRLAPLIEGFVHEYSNVTFIKVDGEKNRAVLSQYNITGFPTLLIFKNGSLIQKLVGLRDVEEYRELFNSLYPK